VPGFREAGCILPVSLATFGFSGQGLPVLVAHPAVTAFAGNDANFLSLVNGAITQNCPSTLRLLLPQHLGAIVLGVSLWAIIVGRRMNPGTIVVIAYGILAIVASLERSSSEQPRSFMSH